MQKIISVNIIKQMLPVIKTKLNTKIERRVNELIKEDENKKSIFKQKKTRDEFLIDVKHEMGIRCDLHFVRELEICTKNPGDVLLEPREIDYLNSLYEAEL